MALNGGSPALWSNRECGSKVLIAEKRLPVLFAFPLDLHSGCVEITQPPGNPNGSSTIASVVEDLTGGPREQIAAGPHPSLRIQPIHAPDQSNPRLLQQVIELLRPALLLATGRTVGQAQMLESLLIAPCNAGRQSATGLMPQVTLRNQGISATDPTVQRSPSKRLALWCRRSALSCRIMGATVLD